MSVLSGLTLHFSLSSFSNCWKFIIESKPLSLSSSSLFVSLNASFNNANTTEINPSFELVRTLEGKKGKFDQLWILSALHNMLTMTYFS